MRAGATGEKTDYAGESLCLQKREMFDECAHAAEAKVTNASLTSVIIGRALKKK